MDIQSLFREAEREVVDSGIAPEFQPAAFSAAVQFLSGGHSPDQMHPGNNGHSAEGNASATSHLDLTTLAGRLGVSTTAVEAVYTQTDGEIQLSVDPRKLSKSKSAGAREVALLVAVPRQAAGEDRTHIDEFRRAAVLYDRFDPPNFAAAMMDLRGTFHITGQPRQRTFKLTMPGWTAAGELVRRLGEAS